MPEEIDPVDEIVQLYQTENYIGLKERGVIDPLRLITTSDMIKRANKEKDPADRYRQMAEITNTIKQAVAAALVTEYRATPSEEDALMTENIVRQGLSVLEQKLS